MRYILSLLICLVFMQNSVFGQNWALEFDGFDDYVTINNNAMDGLSNCTVEYWIFIVRERQAAVPISCAGEACLNEFLHFFQFRDNDFGFRVYIKDEDPEEVLPFPVAEWFHFAFTREAGGGWIAYVNGEEFDNGNLPGGALSIANQGLILGQEQDEIGGGFDLNQALHGMLDELRIWNLVRSEDEIRFHMNRVVNPNTDGLVAYYRFDEGEGQVLIDLTENGYDGRLGVENRDDDADPNWIESEALVFGLGTLSGSVTDAASDQPLEGASIITSDGLNTQTDADGLWLIDQAYALEFDISAAMLGYNDSTFIDLLLEEDEDLEIDFRLLHPELIVSVDEIEAELNPGQSAERQFSIRNDGNGPMQWWVESRLIGESGVDPWVVRDVIPAGQILENNRLQGVVFVEDLFYVTGGDLNPNLVYTLDREGGQVGSFEQFGHSRIGMRDLAYDGELIWGVEAHEVFGFTVEGELVADIRCPVNPSRGIAFDSDRGILWVCGTTTNIYGLDREGNVLEEINRNGLRIYGLSYWSEDPDGFGLYVFHRPEADLQIITKINPDTGDMIFVTELEFEPGGEPGGMFFANEYDPFGGWVQMNIAYSDRGDQIVVRQLKPNNDWMIIDPLEGLINPEDEQDIVLILDAEILEPIVYEGELIFNHVVALEETRIPVTLTIEGNNNQPRDLRVSMTEGWNMISISVIPPEDLWQGEEGPDVLFMTERLRIDEDNHHIILMKNGIGRFYAPAWDNFNNIPYWDLTHGYLIKVDEDVDVDWSGMQIPADGDIPLTEGWNMISYYPTYELDASAPDFYVLSPIIDRVILAKNNGGRFLSTDFRFSNMPPWHETQGYQVKVDGDLVLNYPEEMVENVIARSKAIEQSQRLHHFVCNDITNQNMSVLVTKISGTNLQIGDEIGAFNSDGKLVGVNLVDSRGRCGIAIWGEDETTEEVDGLREGDTFSLSFWDSDQGIESELTLESIESGQDLKYLKDSFIVLSVSVDRTIPIEFYMSPAYPNPFNSTTTIEYALSYASDVTLNLNNLSGQRVETLVNGRLQAGVHRTMLDAGGLASGLYFVKLEGSGQSITQKIMLLK